MKKIVVILPTYNERDNIQTLIEKIQSVFKILKIYRLHVLVVDDYSPDGTEKIIKQLISRYNNISLISKKKEGLGAAYVYGMNYAIKQFNPDLLVQMDADWSHDPLLLPKFIEKIESGADFVIGSRYIRGGSIPQDWGLHRKLFSVVGNRWVRFGLGILSPHDWSSGYRTMKTGVFEKVSHGLEKYSGYLFQIAFLHRVKKAGFKIEEVPLVFIDRVRGKSKFPAFEYIKSVSLYVINNSTFIKYVVIGIIGFTVQTFVSKILIFMKFFSGTAVSTGTFFAIVTNFIGNNTWTFGHKRIMGKKLLGKFAHFCLTSSGALIIQYLVVGGGEYMFGTNRYWFWLMVFAIIFLVIPYNYIIYNRFIWRTHE